MNLQFVLECRAAGADHFNNKMLVSTAARKLMNTAQSTCCESIRRSLNGWLRSRYKRNVSTAK